MDVLVTGATGFVGRRVCAAFAERGDRVRILSRDAESARARVPTAQAAFAWEPMSGPPDPEALSGVDVVVHLAGESVAGRWSAERRRAIHDSRRVGTANLVRGLKTSGTRCLVSASAIGYYGDRGDEELHESAAPGDDFLAEVCRDWEEAARGAEADGTRVVVGRIGMVLGPEGGALDRMRPLFRAGLGGRLGSGRQWWSWIHVEDLVRALLFLADSELSGAVNLTAPAPCTQRDFARALGRALGRPAVLPAPAFGLRAVLGGFASELLASRRVLPTRLLEVGFVFGADTIESAMRASG